MKLSVGQAAEVRLGRQRAPQYEQGEFVIPYLRSANVIDGDLDLADVKQMNFLPAEQAIFRLEPGDVLMTEGSGSRDTVGTSAVWRDEMPAPVCFQNTLLRLRPRPDLTDGRYLAWWARHARLSGQIAAVSSGANILHIGSDGLKRLTIDVPALPEQRRIADFLDDRIDRIDRIVDVRRQQVTLVEEQYAASLQRLTEVLDAPLRPLQTLTDPARPIQYGIVLPGPDFPGGVPIIKGGDIGSGRLAHLDLNRTDPEIDLVYRRSRVWPGDYVIAIRGSVGEIAPVPSELEVANLTQDSARIAPYGCDPRWLGAVLQSSGVQSEMDQRVTGATIRGINIGELRRVPIAVPTLLEQERIGVAAQDLQRNHRDQAKALARSVDLLTEYRASLITAAVTGELDVTTAGSSIPG